MSFLVSVAQDTQWKCTVLPPESGAHYSATGCEGIEDAEVALWESIGRVVLDDT